MWTFCQEQWDTSESQPDQVGSSLMYSARGYENDKNTGALKAWFNRKISPGQTTCCIDNTSITCGKSWDEECALSPDFTFHRRREELKDLLTQMGI